MKARCSITILISCYILLLTSGYLHAQLIPLATDPLDSYDTYVQGGVNSATVNKDLDYMEVKKSSNPDEERIAFLRTNLSGVQTRIDSATLWLFGASETQNTTLDVYYVFNDAYQFWSMNYDTMPVAKVKIGEITFTTTYDWQSVDISHWALADRIRKNYRFGIRLEGQNEADDMVTISSQESFDFTGFYIEYYDNPDWVDRSGKTFYVDATGGNDANDGESEATAWQTLDHINMNVMLEAGDDLLFKAGEEWHGVLIPQGNGKSGKKITIGAYGDIETLGRPAIHGGSNSNVYTILSHYQDRDHIPTVFLYNMEYVELRDLEITNYDPSQEGGKTLAQWEADNDAIAAQSTPLADYTTKPVRYGVLCQIFERQDHDDVHMYNLEVHGVNGNLDFRNSSGILCETENKAYYSNLRVEDCYIHDIDRQGFQTIQERDNRDADFPADADADDTWIASTVVLRRNVFENIAGNGAVIRVAKAGSVAEYNLFDHCGIKATGNAIYPFNCDDFLMQYNEGRFTKYNVANPADPSWVADFDQAAFDLDFRTFRTVMQYNYSHDNATGLLVTGGESLEKWQIDAVVRYNLFERDGQEGIENDWVWRFSGNAQNTTLHNNVVYVNDNDLRVVYTDFWNSVAPTDTFFYNNVFYEAASASGVTFTFNGSTNDVFSNNYISSSLNNKPTNPGGISSGANFASVGGGVDGWKIDHESSLYGAGTATPFTALPQNDFYGRQLLSGTTSFDVGIHQLDSAKAQKYVVFTSAMAPPLGLTVLSGGLRAGEDGASAAKILVYGDSSVDNYPISVSGDPRFEIVDNEIKLIAGNSVTGVSAIPLTLTVIGDDVHGNPVIYEQDIVIDVSHERIRPNADTYVRNGIDPGAGETGTNYFDNNYGDKTEMRVKGSTTDEYYRESFMRFDVSGLAAVDSASVNLSADGEYDTDFSIDIYDTFDIWDEMAATYASGSPFFLNRISSLTVGDTWSTVSADISNDVIAAVQGDGAVSLGLRDDTFRSLDVYIKSKETVDAQRRPYLDIVYAYNVPADDAYVRGGVNSSNNYGNRHELNVKTSSADNTREAYLKFNLSSLPKPESEVNSAQLSLYGSADIAVTLNVYLVSNDSWNESSINWNSKPAAGSLIGSINLGTSGAWHTIDVSSEVSTQLAGDNTLSLLIRDDSASGALATIESYESDVSPYLHLTFVDNEAPYPAVMTFSDDPDAETDGTISMGASIASDPSGVEYYFDCVHVSKLNAGGLGYVAGEWPINVTGGSGTGMQIKITYVDSTTGELRKFKVLNPGTGYAPGDVVSVPAGDPLLSEDWLGDGLALIDVVALDDVTFDSGWQNSPTYIASGLALSTLYTWTVQARDKSPSQFTNGVSELAGATTTDNPFGVPPTPDPMSFASAPTAIGSDSITMTAITAIDTDTVYYMFECINDPTKSSSWQLSTTYVATGLAADTLYTFTVKARDPGFNETAPSAQASATTGAGSDPNADDDGDGIENLLETALGGDPNVVDVDTISPTVVESGSNLDFTFRKWVTGINYYVETSEDLSTWTNFATHNGPETDTVVVESIPMNTYPSGKLFVRLRVEQ